jgi:hypothetical protein
VCICRPITLPIMSPQFGLRVMQLIEHWHSSKRCCQTAEMSRNSWHGSSMLVSISHQTDCHRLRRCIQQFKPSQREERPLRRILLALDSWPVIIKGQLLEQRFLRLHTFSRRRW